MRSVTLFIFLSVFICEITYSQNVDSLKERSADLSAQIKSMETELKSTKALIPPTYGWNKGFTGTVGFSLSNLNNWVRSSNPNSVTSSILGSFSAYANLREERYFWRNSAQLNLGWQKQDLNREDVEDEGEYQATVDVLQMTSLLGYKLGPKFAISALTELRTTVIEDSFDPTYLDVGVGMTWTPNVHLTVSVHPLNYNFVFASEELDFESSLGAKFLASYQQEIIENIKFRSNLTGFMSYEEIDELSNVTWTSGINFTAFKGVGVGIEYALRWNKQETREVEDDIQSYFMLGLSYNF